MADDRGRRPVLWRALLALWPRSRWGRALLIAVPLLLVVAAIAPFFSVASALVDLATRLLAPLVESATGRLLLLNGVLLAAGATLALAMRGRIRDLRSGLRLRAHLDGMAALIGGDVATAEERLRRAARSRALPPRDLPELGDHARLCLARLALEAEDVGRALRWLDEVRDAGLPAELRRSVAQLRFRALEQQDGVLPEEVERTLQGAISSFPDDVVSLRRLRELLRGRGALDEAVDVQRSVVESAAPADVAAERTRLAHDLVLAGTAALRSGPTAVEQALARAEAARRADPDAVGPHLLRGDALRVQGDVRGALRAYAQAADGEGLRRAVALLDAFPDTLAPREILESFPLDGGILLVARAHAHRGEPRAAGRAARLAFRHLGATLDAPATDAPARELLAPEDPRC